MYSKVKKSHRVPSSQTISWFSEHPEEYESFKKGNEIIVPTYLLKDLPCEVTEEDLTRSLVDDREIEEEEKEKVTVELTKDEVIPLTEELLTDVDGIGSSRAQDILAVYSNEIDFMKDILQDNLKVDLPESIKNKLKEEYSKEQTIDELFEEEK